MRKPTSDRMLLRATLLLWVAAALPAVDTSKFKPTGYVNDFAGVLDQRTKVETEALLRRLDRAAGAQVALVTILTLEGEPIEDVANRLYREWGIGKKETDEGVLVLLAVNDRKYRAEVGYGLEPILPDGFVGGMMRSVRPALAQGHYSAAMQTVAQELARRIADQKGVSLEGLPERPRAPSRGGLPVWVVLLGLFFLLLLLSGGSRGGPGVGSMHGRRRYGGAPVILPFPMGGGGWGGGGFGGGGFGGGGFGGFGGGSSGGGGASGGW
jgi:uncharacterized protein